MNKFTNWVNAFLWSANSIAWLPISLWMTALSVGAVALSIYLARSEA